MPRMWSRNLIGARLVVLPRSLSKRLIDERAQRMPLETGGFLLGLRRGDDMEVTDVTSQGMGDRATRYSFERRGAHHQRSATQAWNDGGGLVGLIGDWHSHPSGGGEASETDYHAWGKLLKSIRKPGVGVIASPAGLSIYRLEQLRRRVFATEMVLIEESDTDLVFASGAAA